MKLRLLVWLMMAGTLCAQAPLRIIVKARPAEGIDEPGRAEEVEAVIAELLADAGYEVIDNVQLAAVQGVDLAIWEGNAEKLLFLNTRFGAELVVAATYDKQMVSPPSPMWYYLVNGKMLRTDTGAHVGSVSAKSSRPRESQQHLRPTVEDFTTKLLEKLARLELREAQAGTFQLFVSKGDAVRFGQLQTALGAVEGVESVRQRRFQTDTVELEVVFAGTREQLVQKLHALRDPALRVTGFETVRIDAELTDDPVPLPVDSTAPVVQLSAPEEGARLAERSCQVEGSVDDRSVGQVMVQIGEAQPTAVAVQSGRFSLAVTLPGEGEHRIVARARDAAGNEGSDARTVFVDSEAPEVTILAPADGQKLGDSRVLVRVSVTSPDVERVMVNGAEAQAMGKHEYQVELTLADGAQTIEAKAWDRMGNEGKDAVSVTVHTRAPQVVLDSPVDGTRSAERAHSLAGSVDDPGIESVELLVDAQPGQALAVQSGRFEAALELEEGEHRLRVVAVNSWGRSGEAAVQLSIDLSGPTLRFVQPVENALLNVAAALVRVEVGTDARSVQIDGVQAKAVGKDIYEARIELQEGENLVQATAIDGLGNSSQAQRRLVVDTLPPRVAILAPAAGTAGRQARTAVVGQVFEPGIRWVRSGGLDVPVQGLMFVFMAELQAGRNTITVEARDAAGNQGVARVELVRDVTPPGVRIVAPEDGARLAVAELQARLSVTGDDVARVELNGVPAVADGNERYLVNVALSPGQNELLAKAWDHAGNEASHSVRVTRDSGPPQVSIDGPADGSLTREGSVQVQGRVEDDGPVAEVFFAGQSYPLRDGAFSFEAALVEGSQRLEVRALDAVGQEGQAAVTVVRDTTPPTVEILAPADGSRWRETSLNVGLRVAGNDIAGVSVNGVAAALFQAPDVWRVELTGLSDGALRIEAEAVDQAGNVGRAAVSITIRTTAPEVDAKTTVIVDGKVDDPSSTVTVNGVQVVVKPDGSWETTVDIGQTKRVEIIATDLFGNKSVKIIDYSD